MKRKSLIALLLVLVMVLGLAACANNTEAPAENPAPTESEKTVAPKEETPAAPVEEQEPASEAAWDTSKKDEIIVTVINGYYTAGEKKLRRSI